MSILILLVILGIIAVILIGTLIRLRIYNKHKETLLKPDITPEEYDKEVEQFGIYANSIKRPKE